MFHGCQLLLSQQQCSPMSSVWQQRVAAIACLMQHVSIVNINTSTGTAHFYRRVESHSSNSGFGSVEGRIPRGSVEGVSPARAGT